MVHFLHGQLYRSRAVLSSGEFGGGSGTAEVEALVVVWVVDPNFICFVELELAFTSLNSVCPPSNLFGCRMGLSPTSHFELEFHLSSLLGGSVEPVFTSSTAG